MSDLAELIENLRAVFLTHADKVGQIKAALAPEVDLDMIIDQMVAVNQERDAMTLRAIDAYLKRNGTVRATIKDL